MTALQAPAWPRSGAEYQPLEKINMESSHQVPSAQQLQVALQQSEARFQKLAANIPGVIYQFRLCKDGSVSFPFLSSGCRNLLEIEPETGQQDAAPLLAMVHALDREEFERGVAISAATLQPWQWSGRFIVPSGKVKWIQAASRPERQENGDILWDGLLMDITAQKQAEVERDRFFSTALDMFCIVDPQGYFKRLNPVWEKTLGYTTAELMAEPFVAWVHPDDRETTLAAMNQLAAGVSNVSFKNRYRCKNGSYRWLSWKSAVFPDEGSIYAIARDISDRKQAEDILQGALEQAEYQSRLLRTVLDATPDWIFAKDSDFRYILVNRSYAEAINQTVDAILGKTDIELGFPPELVFGNPEQGIRGFRADDQAVLAGNVIHNPYDPATIADGSLRIFDAQKFPLRNPEGKIFAALGFCRDVTERHHSELALKQSEQQLRQSADQLWAKAQREKLLNQLASQIRSSLDLNQILAEAVQAIQDLLQIDSCSFLWFQPESEVPFWEIVQEARKPDAPSLLGFKTPSSTILPMAEKLLCKEIICIPDVGAEPNPVTREFYQAMKFTAVLAIPVHTPSGAIGAIGCANFADCRAWAEHELTLIQAVTDHVAIAIEQAELYKHSHVAAATAQAKAAELETLLQELQKTQTRLVQSEKMSSLGQLVAGVAHEINNPVNFIYGNITHAKSYTQDLLGLVSLYQEHYPHPVPAIQDEAEAIDLEFLMEDLPKLLTSMKVGAERIQQIVRSLRTFSRMDEADMKAVDIHEGLDSTLMILQNRLKARPDHPAVEVIKEYGDLPLIECYAGQLNQVFMNILTNALDALEERDQNRTPAEMQEQPSQIRISTGRVGTTGVQIRIADNGSGIPESVQSRLFDPFFTTKPVGKGTGLGMSICYQIVTEKHGGSLVCHSQAGQGAEFVIEIPLKQP